MGPVDSPVVRNCHHIGQPGTLPHTVKYVGRPSVYGNPFSSQDGKRSKEECVALHRLDLYQRLENDPTLLSTLQSDLAGYDLACWCVHPKNVMACHAFTYLHILHPDRIGREYSRGPVVWAMDDIRTIFALWDERMRASPQSEYLLLFLHLGDLHLTVRFLIVQAKHELIPKDRFLFALLYTVVDMECALRDSDPAMVTYRFDHALWVLNHVLDNRTDHDNEPQSPRVPVKRKRLKAVSTSDV